MVLDAVVVESAGALAIDIHKTAIIVETSKILLV